MTIYIDYSAPLSKYKPDQRLQKRKTTFEAGYGENGTIAY